MKSDQASRGGRPFWTVALRGLALGALALAGSCVSPAPEEGAPGELTLERVVMFSRHGVRPPTRLPVLPPGYAREAWPAWDVDPGHLTARGYEGARLIGAWTRQNLAARGLFAESECPAEGAVFVRTNTIHRTRESGRAFLEGFAPSCGVPIAHSAGERDDPLFDAIDLGRAPFDPAAARAAIEARAGGDLAMSVARVRPAFDRLSEILGCCAPALCQEAGLSEGCSLGDLPHVWEDTPANRRVRFTGPFAQGGTAAQSLLLAYVEGKPMREVGWGRASAQDIALLSEIHAVEFDLLARTPYIARRAAAFILDHVMETLRAPQAPALSLLVGHDTNIANLGGVLDLHWRVPGYAPDDQAVSGAIGFELLRDAQGRRYVRVFYQAPSADQLRALTPLTPDNPPYLAYLEQPLCAMREDRSLCRLEDFLRTTDAVLVRETDG